MKTCTKCGVSKALDDFPPRGSGLHTECRDCQRAYKREYGRKWRAANPTAAAEATRRWRVNNPERAVESDRQFRLKHRDKILARNRATRAADPEKAREAFRRWRASNVERERLRAHARRLQIRNDESNNELVEFVASLLAQPCTYCGATENITIDHVVPLSRGGKHEAMNLAPACLPCNSSKCNRLLSEWSGRLDAAA